MSADPLAAERPDAAPAPETGGARAAGERALKNTVVRAVGEIVGKLASLAVFAVLARKVGPADLGTYVFAMSWGEATTTPVGIGLDRYLLRRVARDRASLDEVFYNTLVLKLARGLPVLALTIVAVLLLDFSPERQAAICLLTAGVFADTLSRTSTSTFNGLERGELVAGTIIAQRFGAAAFSLAALAAGYGVVAVSVGFLLGGLIRLGLSFHLLARKIGMPARVLPRAPRRELRSVSLPYTAQDLFGLVIARADVLLLSALATSAVVGVYGAAYRLLDATGFIGVSLGAAFSAMYTYLGEDTVPTIRSVFGRSIKLCLLALMPIAVTFGVLAEPLSRAFFGSHLVSAAVPLRLLAPVVVMLGVVGLSTGLIVSRRNPRTLLSVIAVAAVVNLGANLVLIPPLGAEGAAITMILTALAFLLPSMAIATRAAGGMDWVATLAAPLGAGAAMGAAMALVGGPLAVAIAIGALVYLGAYAALERAISPGDLDFAIATVRRRLPGRRSAAV